MTKKILYGVGIGVMFLMVIGLIINFCGTLGIVAVVCLCTGFIGTRMARANKAVTIPKLKLPSIRFVPIMPYLFILPVLGVIGATLVNTYQNNIVLMVLMVLLAVMPIIAMFTKWLPERYYALAIWAVALSLLLHRSLISNYLWGSDINGEFACYQTVMQNGVWNPNTPYLIPAYNTSLAVTILPAMINRFSGIDGIWIFKIVFPILFSLVPVVMYEFTRTQFGNRKAFLATFLVMSLYIFYTMFVGVQKQLIATFFLALFILVMTDKELPRKWQIALLVVFGVGVTVSHYSTAFLLAILLCGTLVILLILKRKPKVITIPVIAVVVPVIACWYLMGNASVLKQFLGMSSNALAIPGSLAASQPIPPLSQSESIKLITQGSINLPDSLRYMYLITQAFIAVGALVAFIRWMKRKTVGFTDEFMCFAMLVIVLLGLELVLPKFSVVVTLDRIYFVCLMVLAPFGIIGVKSG